MKLPTFACHFPAEHPRFIPIDIVSNAWVPKLLKVIQVKLQLFSQEVSLEDFRVFKVNVLLLWKTAN